MQTAWYNIGKTFSHALFDKSVNNHTQEGCEATRKLCIRGYLKLLPWMWLKHLNYLLITSKMSRLQWRQNDVVSITKNAISHWGKREGSCIRRMPMLLSVEQVQNGWQMLQTSAVTYTQNTPSLTCLELQPSWHEAAAVMSRWEEMQSYSLSLCHGSSVSCSVFPVSVNAEVQMDL